MYRKAVAVMKYISTNLQREGEGELKESVADYIGVKQNEDSDEYKDIEGA